MHYVVLWLIVHRCWTERATATTAATAAEAVAAAATQAAKVAAAVTCIAPPTTAENGPVLVSRLCTDSLRRLH